MRVISGKYKGKQIAGHHLTGTRPTMDRVKESMFAMIQSHLANSVCLDLFAGSGALGIEALSNGAQYCYFVDTNRSAIQTIQRNLEGMDQNYMVLQKDYLQALEYFKNQQITFDLIILDPPYQSNFIMPCLHYIKNFHLLNENGVILCEYEFEGLDEHIFSILKEKTYGSKKVTIYQKN